MADSYWHIGLCASDPDMQSRVAACAAQQQSQGANIIGDPFAWALEHRLTWASSPGWGAAWESALVAENPAPGRDPAVISDGMILATVQQLAGS